MLQKSEHMTDILDSLHKECKLNRWNELVKEVQLTDHALLPALMSGRPELIKLAKPHPLTEEECKQVYNLIGVLIETNHELQRHAEHVAQLVESWTSHFKGLSTTAYKIEEFANFRNPAGVTDDL